jgi:hypothetical protein
MNKETLRMQMLAGIITEGEYKTKLKKNKSSLNENLKFNQIEKNRKYFATTNFGIFKKGDEVFVNTVRNLGTEVVIELSNNKGQSDSIKGDLNDEVEVFDNNIRESLKENFVGMGMVGNIFDREKTDYEIAFEHFSKGKMNEEIDEEQAETEESFEDVFLDETEEIKLQENQDIPNDIEWEIEDLGDWVDPPYVRTLYMDGYSPSTQEEFEGYADGMETGSGWEWDKVEDITRKLN